ncbi:MAG: hypothetical protein AB1898_20005 [Acidobacteriota bacterium]
MDQPDPVRHEGAGSSNNQETTPQPAVGSSTKPDANLQGLLLKLVSFVRTWLATTTFPAWLTLSACVIAAFLVWPAYRGFSSASTLVHLQDRIRELEESLGGEKKRWIELDRKLAERDLLLTQRQQATTTAPGISIYLAPLLSPDRATGTLRDLIQVSFAFSDHAMLALSLPAKKFVDADIRILQAEQTIWSQKVDLASETMGGDTLAVLDLTSSALRSGEYQLVVDGNLGTQPVAIARYDLLVER